MKTKITGLDDFGRGVTRINDKICFVKNALPEEIVDIDIVKEKKKYQVGTVNNYIEKSDKRITPKCKYYDICGGCNLEHISLEEENRYKKDKVEKIIEKFSGKKVRIKKIVSEDEYGYRNKITLRVEKGKICLLEEESNKLIEIEECHLVEDKINDIIKKLKEIIKEEHQVSKIMIRISNDLEKIMIKVDGNVVDINSLKEISDSLIINDKVIKEEYLLSNILDKKFYISSNSFFQVNRKITEKMYKKIIEIVKDNKPKKVLDLYCGVGTIGICISDYTDSVLGVEVVEKAVESAIKNKELNKVDNIDFKCGKVENIIDNSYNTYDLIIVDPPRSGLDRTVVEVLNNSNSKIIVYVSCDPVTLARDIKLFDNYEIKEVELFNMFPRTYHCESVCILERR
jgi:23S rRNA (uracil1939-C5)-methyltransferase